MAGKLPRVMSPGYIKPPTAPKPVSASTELGQGTMEVSRGTLRPTNPRAQRRKPNPFGPRDRGGLGGVTPVPPGDATTSPVSEPIRPVAGSMLV